MKTSELTGSALDWAVAKCEGYECQFDNEVSGPWLSPQEGYLHDERPLSTLNPSTDWSQGGPIIERECICTYASGACSVAPKNPDYWVAEILETDGIREHYGETPLIAAMRCYVASKLGGEVEIPEELK